MKFAFDSAKFLQLLQECHVFWTPIGIVKMEAVGSFSLAASSRILRKGVILIPPARKTAAFAGIRMQE